ncbi:hypothetical protein C8Q74DRAFT_1245794 [Fomes fomentarius]|nr:hypothetical protein C8Q74DRAFT_1245794 [Fomes fomentarius]
MQAPISHSEVSKPSSIPWFPPELISQILTELWDASQCDEERALLTRTVCLVNRTWLSLFLRISLRDVHLPSPFSADDFLRLLPENAILPGQGNPFSFEASQLANHACRTLTFRLDGHVNPGDDGSQNPPAIKVYSDTDPASSALSTVLYMVTTLGKLPNLRRISLEYIDWGYENIFDQLSTPTLPPQVTHLSAHFAFTTPALAPLATYLKTLFTRRDRPRVTHPNVRRLSLAGIPMELVADMLQIFPNVETLEIMSGARLYVLGTLPPSVRTIVLRHPGMPLEAEEMQWWGLESALEGGLFLPGAEGRIILQSGTPDPIALTQIKRACKRHRVGLSYERDDGCPACVHFSRTCRHMC